MIVKIVSPRLNSTLSNNGTEIIYSGSAGEKVYNPIDCFSFLHYSHAVNSWFDYSAGISRCQVAPSLTDTLFSSFLYGNITLGFEWKILYSKVSLGGVLSEGTSGYLQLANSRYFETPHFIDGKAYFSFDPYINMLFGSYLTLGIFSAIALRKYFRKNSYINYKSLVLSPLSPKKVMQVLQVMSERSGDPDR